MKEQTLIKIDSLYRHAESTVPFYQKIGKSLGITNIVNSECFEQLPLVTKADIQRNPQDFLSEMYTRYPLNKDISIHRTSGSTGQYLKIYWSQAENIRSLSELWLLRKNRYDIIPSNKYAYFYTNDYIANTRVEPKEMLIAPNKRSIGFWKGNLNKNKIVRIYEHLLDFSPDWIMLQPSVAVLIADSIRENNFTEIPGLRYIELTGEYLSLSVQDYLKEIFRCAVSNQYGCNEANSIALTCLKNQFHCLESNVYIEIIQNGKNVGYNTLGDIYITVLTNYAMPFIRYQTGDRGILREINCDCGSRAAMLELVAGRVSDFVLTRYGEKIPSYIFLYPIEYINEKIGNIIQQFQIVQYDVDKFLVRLSIKPSYNGWKETVSQAFVASIKEEALTGAFWDFEFTNGLLPDNTTGKLAYFYNKMQV